MLPIPGFVCGGNASEAWFGPYRVVADMERDREFDFWAIYEDFLTSFEDFWR